jgi:tRNA-2-methylthio-N6-dimethylallyladenosine synthase
MKGCNERCSYCIVPYTRGPERYRASHEIVDEVKRLVDSGVREVTLLGQTVNSYKDPAHALPQAPYAGECRWQHTRGALAREDETEFPALLRRIAAEVPGLARLRYTSPHPRHLTTSLIEAHRELPVLARHVHMPVQSGSDRLLKRMIRRYSAAEYIERTDALKEAVPGLTLTTDVIVGFPGETDEDFEATLELVRRVAFVALFGFKYSQRPYTPALQLADDVSEEEKGRRLERLFSVVDERKHAHLASLVGRTERVLVEGLGRVQNEGAASYTGRTERSEIVHFTSPIDLTGHMVEVRVREAFKNSLGGDLVTELSPEFLAGVRPLSKTPAPPQEKQTADGRRILPVLG